MSLYPIVHSAIIVLEYIRSEIPTLANLNTLNDRPNWLPIQFVVTDIDVTSYYPTKDTVLVRLRLQLTKSSRSK